jgi:hypothetical protein
MADCMVSFINKRTKPFCGVGLIGLLRIRESVHPEKREKSFSCAEVDDKQIQQPQMCFEVNFYFAVLDASTRSVE